MDAVKFIEERRRMSKATRGYSPIMLERIPAEDIVKEVEEWSAAHPIKTRQEVFLEQYPEARLDSNGVLRVCPALVSKAHRGDYGVCSDISKECAVCCCEFWTKVVG